MEKIRRRMIWIFGILFFVIAAVTLQIYSVTTTPAYKEKAEEQKIRKKVLEKSRGIIYDYNLQPLVCEESEDKTYEFDGQTYTYQAIKRYQDEQIASHIVGYISSDYVGVSGIEKAFETQLSECSGQTTLDYLVAANGKRIADTQVQVVYDRYNNKSGVVLTIDKKIQKIADEALREYGKKGAVVAMDANTGALRAVSSYPTVNPNHVSEDLEDEDNPFINRAFESYNVGSIFKLVIAAVALECGVDKDLEYECTGEIDIDGRIISCFDKKAHGLITMEEAIGKSCNSYFVNLSQQLKAEDLLYYSQKFGFSEKTYFANGLYAKKGNLPSLQKLKSNKEKASFSFGQGDLMATPIQIAELVSAIVNGGERKKSYLVEGLSNESGQIYNRNQSLGSFRVISKENAMIISNMMVGVAENGTGRSGMPEGISGGAKTATAETGIIKNGEKILQTWYAGFTPKDDTKYIIVVLIEDGESGGNTAGPIFKRVAGEIE